MTPITPNNIYQRSPSATHQSVAGEAILIDLNTGSYYSLNETGTWLWEHLDGKRTIGELAMDLAVACDIPDQVSMVQQDLNALVANLLKEGLVIVS